MANLVERLFRNGAPVLDRNALVQKVRRHLGGDLDPAHLRALLEVPRELFVRPEDVGSSAEDVPLPLDESGLATISAPHAYLLSFRLLGLTLNDRLVELGSGSGYGAALAAKIVGPRGSVLTIEIDPTLARRAKSLLAGTSNVRAIEHDAITSTPYWRGAAWGAGPERWRGGADQSAAWGANKIVCTFAVEEIPRAWLEALGDGNVLVAPVGRGDADQQLVRVSRTSGHLSWKNHCAVRYVKNRSVT